ncbi:hypothetical protein JCM8202v2_004672 [Rhodotorula sphaerocarpa]
MDQASEEASSSTATNSGCAFPAPAERPVVLQCPYTLSSCPLFNPTFSTAEVLEAAAESPSQLPTGIATESTPPPSGGEPGQSTSSMRKYGLAESMRNAASPPAKSVELDHSSPFQYIDFSIAPIEDTPSVSSQSLMTSRGPRRSASPRLRPTSPRGGEMFAEADMPRSRRLASGTSPEARYPPVSEPQMPVLALLPNGVPALPPDPFKQGAPEAVSPCLYGSPDLSPALNAHAPLESMRRIPSGSSSGGETFSSFGTAPLDLEMGPPDLRVAYELAGLAARSKSSQSPSGSAPSLPNLDGTIASVLPPLPNPSTMDQKMVLVDSDEHKTATPFISKLNHLLSDPGLSDVIRWNDDGTVILYAHTSPRLLEILGRFFRHTTVASFARQLNIYAFRRLGTAELLTQLERCRSTGVRGCASEWSGFTHDAMWREEPGGGRGPCDLGKLKPSGPKTEKGKQNLAKKMAENGGSKKRRKRGPETAAVAAAQGSTSAAARAADE